MLICQHALTLFLLIGVPLWDVLETHALKHSANPRRKILSYQRVVSILWTCAIVAWIILRNSVFYTWPAVKQSFWHRGGSFVWIAVWALAVAWIAANSLRAFRRRNTKLRDTTVTAFKRLDFFLPTTREERLWFAALCITAGVCEEVLYRAYLIRYLSDFPWHIGLGLALVVSSVCFGLGHGYQGLSGILSTGLVGAMMSAIFFATGSLWLPMILHAFIDLNILLLLRRGDLP